IRIRKPVPSGKEICERQLFFLTDKLQEVTVNEEEIAPFLPAVYEKFTNLSKEELIKHIVSLEFNRFLDYYGHTPDLNIPDGHEERRSPRVVETEGLTKFRLNVGLAKGISPKEVINFVVEATGRRNVEIGKIDLFGSYSVVEVEDAAGKALLRNSRGMSFRGTFFDVEVFEENRDDRSFRGRRSGGYPRAEGRTDFKRIERKRRY
ncbi:MAG: DbpA RNA binding domain-containing protein, partial [Bacteroidetes bacterium]|nr:DbpA RNA binding domain-containing protein [Bacteroidota bacterium]